MAGVTLLFESSTIFLKTREVLLLCDAADSTFFAANNWAFLLSFFFSRIVNGTFEGARWLVAVEALVAGGRAHSVPVVRMYEVLCSGLTLLNFYWFYTIIVGALKTRPAKGKTV